MVDRVVLLIDMDCFYVQVEQQLQPETLGKPAVVVQYNTWKGGGIIAVNYEARACGVRRSMRGDEARRLCPGLLLFRVPEVRGKADINKYREAGRRVIAALRPFAGRVERASVDEAYVELTAEAARRAAEGRVTADSLANTFVVGYGGDEKTEECRRSGVDAFLESVNSEFASEGDRLLAAGAAICEQMRKAVLDQTGYRCSAGIAHNKVLAKLCAGRNKPNRQTILPHSSVPHLYETLPIKKVRFLGGKLGDAVTEQLACETMADLGRLSLAQLQAAMDEKTGLWLYQLARGLDSEAVADRHLPKSIGCSKNFRGREVLRTLDKVKHWLVQMATEVSERLSKDREVNHRTSRSMTVHVTTEDGRHISRACALTGYAAETIAADAYTALAKLNTAQEGDHAWVPALLNLGVSAGKFSEVPSAACGSIASMFSRLPTAPRAAGSGSDEAVASRTGQAVSGDRETGPLRDEVVSDDDETAAGARATETEAKEADGSVEEAAASTKETTKQSTETASETGEGAIRVNDHGSWLAESSGLCRARGTEPGPEKRPSEDSDSGPCSKPCSKSARTRPASPSRADGSASAPHPCADSNPRPCGASEPPSVAAAEPAVSGFFARKERQIRAEQAAAAAAEPAVTPAPAPSAPCPPSPGPGGRTATSPVRSARGPSSPARRGRGRGRGGGASTPVKRGRGRGRGRGGTSSPARRGGGRGTRATSSPAKRGRGRGGTSPSRRPVGAAVEEDTLALDADAVDAETLAALPEDIRREVEQQLERQRQRRREEGRVRRNGIRRYLLGGTGEEPRPAAAMDGSAAACGLAAAHAARTEPAQRKPGVCGASDASETAASVTDRDTGSPCVAAAAAVRTAADVPEPVAGPSGLTAAGAAASPVQNPEDAAAGPSGAQNSAATTVAASAAEGVSRPSAPGSVASDASDAAGCPRCGQQVSPWELPEHLDYHVALELSEQPTPPPAPARPPVRALAPAPRRRGRPSKAETLRKAGEVRRIDAFFK